MKKLLFIFMMTAAAAALNPCCSVKEDAAVQQNPFDFEKCCKWADDSTLEVTASGTADDRYADKPELIKENAACTAAKINAMTIAAYVINGKKTGGEISVFIKNGETVSSTFSPADSSCTVTYRLSRKNLKNLSKKF